MQIIRDRAFNPWRVFVSPNPVTQQVLHTLDQETQRKEHRPRRRKPIEQRRYEQIVSALICDLAYNHLMQEPCGVHLSRSCAVLSRQFQRRYKPDFLTGKMLPKILDAMERSGLLLQEKGHRGVRPAFAAFMNQTHSL